MKLSTRGRYAARIMVFLASRGNSTPVRKQDITEAEGISSDYAEQLLMKLKTGGLVASHRGVRGGFSLARSADKITLLDVLEASEGPLTLVPCLSEQECRRVSVCVTRRVWEQAGFALKAVLSARTLADLAKEAEQLRSEMAPSYHI